MPEDRVEAIKPVTKGDVFAMGVVLLLPIAFFMSVLLVWMVSLNPAFAEDKQFPSLYNYLLLLCMACAAFFHFWLSWFISSYFRSEKPYPRRYWVLIFVYLIALVGIPLIGRLAPMESSTEE
jgi:magnesium-transporting ATPase (P-type)